MYLIPIIILVPIVVFWFWMFRHMLANDGLNDDPQAPLTFPPTTRRGWIIIFILMNVFGAYLYFLSEYRK